MSTTVQAKAQLSAAIAIAEAIRELKEVPSGHLYARVNQHMTLDAYNGIISALKTADKAAPGVQHRILDGSFVPSEDSRLLLRSFL